MNLIMVDISPILLFLLEFFTYFAQRNAHFFSVPILLKILLAKFINAYSQPPPMYVHTLSLNLPLNASLHNLTFTLAKKDLIMMLIGMARGIPGGVIGKGNF